MIPRTRSRQSGFTLIEALIAIVILVVGLLGVTNMLLMATSSNVAANRGTAATTAAAETMERLKAANFATLVASVGICFAAALLALAFGYSVALGAFIAGSLVAESGEEKTIEHLVQPVRDMFAAIFFVAVGMMIDPGLIAEHWVAVVVFSIVVIVGKIVAVSIGAFLAGYGTRTSVQTGMSLAQIGEFSFIIAGVGLATGATRGFLYPVAVAVLGRLVVGIALRDVVPTIGVGCRTVLVSRCLRGGGDDHPGRRDQGSNDQSAQHFRPRRVSSDGNMPILRAGRYLGLCWSVSGMGKFLQIGCEGTCGCWLPRNKKTPGSKTGPVLKIVVRDTGIEPVQSVC